MYIIPAPGEGGGGGGGVAYAVDIPTITAASVDSDSIITITYSENVDVSTTDGQGFSLSDGTISANSDPGGSSSIITLTVSGITTSDTPDVTYTAAPGTVTGVSSIPAVDQTFTGTVDNAPPTVVSIVTASTTTINLTLSEEITDNSADPGDFVLSGDITTSPTVNAITSNDDIVTLSLSDTLDSDDVISLEYAKSTGSIDDTASLTSFVDSFSVVQQDTSPSGLAFSADGAKMFVVGTTGNNVNEYTLSTPFDVSTATFVDSFSVTSQETSPRGLAFSANGAKMFVVGVNSDNVNEYTLSTPFDVSTAVFVDSFSVRSQDTFPNDLAFSANGAKMFVVGVNSDNVNEYTLSTPFDVSTAVFVDSFSVASQETSPSGLAFSADGAKMFVGGTIGDDVNEYTLSTPFDVSTAFFAGSFSVASQDISPRGLAFSTNGDKMFVAGNAGDDVNEYTLAKPFTFIPNSLASFAAVTVENNIAPSPDVITPLSITAASVDSDSTITITYSENVDVSTTDGQGFSLSTGAVSANSDPGGSSSIITLTVSGITTSDTPDVTYSELSGSVTGVSSIPAEDQTIGTTDNAPPTVVSIVTASTTTINLTLSEEITDNSADPGDFVLSGDITTSPTVLAIAANENTVTLSLSDSLDYDDVISLAYAKDTGSIDDITSPSFVDSFSVRFQDTFPEGLAFSTDGAKMFVAGESGDDVSEYTLTAPFDVSSAVFVDSFSVRSQDKFPSGLAFSANGAKMFVLGVVDDDVNEYTLSTPFDVSTAVFVDSFSVASQDGLPRGLAFSTNGAKMFVVGDDGNDVNEYTLSTPFDVSTASFVDSFSVASQETSPQGLAFFADGYKMFVVGSVGDDVNEYTLTAPFDVSTASFAGSFSVASEDTVPTDLAFSADGAKMFVLGDNGNDVNEYTLAKPFTVLPNSLAGFDAASPVANNIIPPPGTTPTITAASVDSARTITITYDRNIDVTTINGAGFALSVGEVSANSDPGGLTNTMTLTVSGITTSDTPDITYTIAQGSVVDGASNIAANQIFTDTVDSAPPIVLSIETAGTTIDLTLSEDVINNSAAPGDFVLSGDITTNPTVDAITADGDTVTLSLSGILDYDDVISLAYAKDTGSIDDTASPSFVDSFSVASQDGFPIGLAFSADGTKMFVVGNDGDDVSEYTLTVPFDVSAASFVDSFSVGSQDETPTGLAFSANGEKMFVVGHVDQDVNEYTLTAPFDVSTASFVDSFSVASQDTRPYGLAFSADGAKMFVVGSSGDSVNEYTLTTPFDVSTASFVDSFSVRSQDTSPRGLAFSANGDKMFVVGNVGDDVNEYTLTAPFDVSSASFVDSFSVSSQDTFPYGLAFSADGAKMFVAGALDDDVNEYTLTKPFSILPNSLASFDAATVENNIVPPPDATPPSITAASVDSASSITLTYNENIDVATTDGQGFTLSTGTISANSDPGGLTDIITLTVSGITTSDTPDVTYSASPGSVTDASSNSAEDQTIGTTDNAPPTVVSIGTASTTTIDLTLSEEITLNATAPGDFVLSTTISTTPTVDTIAASGDTVTLTLDGTLDGDDDISLAYTKSTGSIDDIISPSFVDSFSVTSQDTIPAGLAFSANGEKMFVLGNIGDDVNEYTLSTPFDVSTASFVDSFSVRSQDTSPRGLAFSANGAKMFVVGSSGDSVNEYTLSTSFDVSTAVFVDSFSVASQDAFPAGLAFSADGYKMFVVGSNDDDVNEYTLSTPFDVSTASFVDSFSVTSQESSPSGLAFSADGYKMFVVGGVGDSVHQYALSAPFDVSTASFAGSFSVKSQDTFPTGLAFSANGEKMFVVGSNDDDVNEYTLAKPFTLLPNSLASFAAATVTNNIAPPDVTPPSITAASVDSDNIITITYSEDIDVSTTNGAGFTLSTGAVSANSDPGGSSSIITLTVSGITTSDTPDVTYTAASGSVTDASSNSAEDQTIGTTDNAPPTVLSIGTASTTTINLILSEEIALNSTAPGDFVLSGDITTSPTVNAIAADGDTVTLSLSGMLDDDDDISLAYSKNTGSIDDTASPSFVDSFSVSSQESSPRGLAFSANGAKMFVVGNGGDNVNEYTLSTPFDVSTATVAGSFSVSSEETSPQGLAFSANGEKMFVVGANGQDVNEYTLSTPFDVSAASFVDSFPVASQETSPTGLAFSTNGAKMFVVGFNGDDVNEYTLIYPL